MLFGHAPETLAAQPASEASLSLPQDVSPGAASPAISLRRTPVDERGRLAVNPVTGLAVSSATNFRPLTHRERLKLYARQNYFSVGAYFAPTFSALVLDQANGTPRQWGGGFSGFGLRMASRTGNAMLEGTIDASLATLLREDVRYISSGRHGATRRIWHAVKYSFLTYNEKGHPTPNFALLSGYYISTAISTVWLPGTRHVARYAFTNGSEQIALSVPIDLLQEFWPEVTHTLFRRPSN